MISPGRSEELDEVGRSGSVDTVLAKPLDVRQLAAHVSESLKSASV